MKAGYVTKKTTATGYSYPLTAKGRAVLGTGESGTPTTERPGDKNKSSGNKKLIAAPWTAEQKARGYRVVGRSPNGGLNEVEDTDGNRYGIYITKGVSAQITVTRLDDEGKRVGAHVNVFAGSSLKLAAQRAAEREAAIVKAIKDLKTQKASGGSPKA